jgi:HEPN domain-containing protein
MNDKQTVIEYWLISSNDDLDSAEHLFIAGKYHHALFFGHLALEKRLKAEIVEATDFAAPPKHTLERLAQKTTIQFSTEQIESLTEITKFNLEARYER